MGIRRMVRNLRSLLQAIDGQEPTEADRYQLQRLFNGPAAITRLHFAQEEEICQFLQSA